MGNRFAMFTLTRAVVDLRHASYILHPMRVLFSQRVFQIASAYEDGNDANTLRRDPLFKLADGNADFVFDLASK